MHQATKKYPCGRIVLETGEPCNFSSDRKFNLDRHQQRAHGEQPNSTFVNFVAVGNDGSCPGAFGRGGIKGHVARATSTEVSSPALETLPLGPYTSFTNRQGSFILNSEISDNPLPSNHAIDNPPQTTLRQGTQEHTLSTAKAVIEAVAKSLGFSLTTLIDFYHSQNQDVDRLECDDIPLFSQDALLCHDSNENLAVTSGADGGEPNSRLTGWDDRRRKKCKRLCDSDGREAVPEYEAERSRQWPRQQRAVAWLTQAGKDHFDHYMEGLLGSWGLKRSHKGTCVLCPVDWSALSPLRLASLFEVGKCPVAWADTPVSISCRRGSKVFD